MTQGPYFGAWVTPTGDVHEVTEVTHGRILMDLNAFPDEFGDEDYIDQEDMQSRLMSRALREDWVRVTLDGAEGNLGTLKKHWDKVALVLLRLPYEHYVFDILDDPSGELRRVSIPREDLHAGVKRLDSLQAAPTRIREFRRRAVRVRTHRRRA